MNLRKRHTLPVHPSELNQMRHPPAVGVHRTTAFVCDHEMDFSLHYGSIRVRVKAIYERIFSSAKLNILHSIIGIKIANDMPNLSIRLGR